MQGIIISQIWPDDNPAVLNFINSFVEFKWVLFVLFPGVVVEIVWIISSDIAGFFIEIIILGFNIELGFGFGMVVILLIVGIVVLTFSSGFVVVIDVAIVIFVSGDDDNILEFWIVDFYNSLYLLWMNLKYIFYNKL